MGKCPRHWKAPGEFHGLTADEKNLIRVIKRLARKLANGHPGLTLAPCVSLACFSHNNGFKTGGYSPVQWAFGADKEGHGFTTTMPSEIETFRMSAMNSAKDALSRAQHTTRKDKVHLESGTTVMYFRRGKVTRGAIGAPSMSGLWLGPARDIMTEAIQQWGGSVHSTTGHIGVVCLSHCSLENADTVIERRRIVGKRTIISPAPLALSDNVDSASVPESLNEAGLPEVLEPSEGDTKKRRVESFDESVN